jgi:hypothetical protein
MFIKNFVYYIIGIYVCIFGGYIIAHASAMNDNTLWDTGTKRQNMINFKRKKNNH